MELPEMVQCILNTSSANAFKEKSRGLPAQMALQAISCQRGKTTRSRKSIAFFQLRKGNLLGSAVSLRGTALYFFLDQYVYLVSPRKGAPGKNLQQKGRVKERHGDYNFGEERWTIFPGLETHFLTISALGGFNCTLSPAPGKKGSAEWLLAALQFPFFQKKVQNN